MKGKIKFNPPRGGGNLAYLGSLIFIFNNKYNRVDIEVLT